jgi:predicted  nucleic acid-binding Zn-ribbon protein
MAAEERSVRALIQLRKIAQNHARDLSLRLAELGRSKVAIEEQIAALRDSILVEQRVAADDPAIGFERLAGFLAGAGSKRSRLSESLAAIDAGIDSLQEAVVAAHHEIQKLDHLLSLAKKARERTQAKQELASLDDAGRRLRAGRQN